MKKLAWLTDIHLDHYCKTKTGTVKKFCEEVLRAAEPDFIVMTGDITNGRDIKEHFEEMAKYWTSIPVYYVLGNHDYYHSSFEAVRKQMDEFVKANPNFHYLSHKDHFELVPGWAIAGHDGWYDGGYADWFDRGTVIMQDYYLITEFYVAAFIPPTYTSYDPHIIYDCLQTKAKECVRHIEQVLPNAMKNYKNVLYATHIPPFKEACIHKGQISDDGWLPNFSSKRAGDALLKVAKANQGSKLFVLCGHTHSDGVVEMTKNLTCYTGASRYGFPLESLQVINIKEEGET